MVDTSEKFRWLVRLGYAARGLVYILLGYLALSTAGSAAGGAQSAFDVLQDIPLGTLVLYAAAVGLLAYAVFKLASAASDVEHHGGGATGVAKRVGDAASAIAHTLLAWTALEFARGSKQAAQGDDAGQQAAGTLLSWDVGGLVLALVGIGLLIAAAMQARNAVTAHFMRRVAADAPGPVCWIGRVGHAARAVVFLVIGWSVLRSAWAGTSTQVKGLGEALASLRENDTVYTLVAIGLLLFGVFSLIVARYRIIPEVHRSDLKPAVR